MAELTMPTLRLFRKFPIFLRGEDIAHPWVYPWFALGTFAIGVPATIQRPPGLWIALALGTSLVISVMFLQWLVLGWRSNKGRHTALVVMSLAVISTVAGVIVHALTPVESFSSEPSNAALGSSAEKTVALPPMTQVYLTTSLILVWIMLWMLAATLVSGQRSYIAERNVLRAARSRIQLVATGFTSTVKIPIHELASRLIADLRRLAGHIAGAMDAEPKSTRVSLLEVLRRTGDDLVSPALEKITSLRLDEERPVPPTGQVKVEASAALEGIPIRWNGRYFSGHVGALIIGVAALSAGASTEFTSPGFLIQIPLIMLAFAVSVAASLILFFTAALTPFLGSNSLAPENYTFFVIIGLLAILSFAHRANEVRQVRVLEGLSVANADLALETVRLQQRTVNVKKEMVSIIHGKLQTGLVAATAMVHSKKTASAEDARLVETILNDAAGEIERAIQDGTGEATTDFASAISDIVNLWSGAISVQVTVTSQADGIMATDRNVAAVVIEVISEATLNAAKHSMTDRVDAHVTVEGNRLRVTATNRRDREVNELKPSTRIGLAFLREITTELRLEVNDHTTTLVAEIPFHSREKSTSSDGSSAASRLGTAPIASNL